MYSNLTGNLYKGTYEIIIIMLWIFNNTKPTLKCYCWLLEQYLVINYAENNYHQTFQYSFKMENSLLTNTESFLPAPWLVPRREHSWSDSWALSDRHHVQVKENKLQRGFSKRPREGAWTARDPLHSQKHHAV